MHLKSKGAAHASTKKAHAKRRHAAAKHHHKAAPTALLNTTKRPFFGKKSTTPEPQQQPFTQDPRITDNDLPPSTELSSEMQQQLKDMEDDAKMQALIDQYDPDKIGDEFDAIPEEQKDDAFVQRLQGLVNNQMNLGYKSHAEIVTGVKRPKEGWNRNVYSDPYDHAGRTMREQHKEDMVSKGIMGQMMEEDILRKLDKETFGLTASEAELERIRQTRSVLRPIRNMMPPMVKKLVLDLVNEAKTRNLNEQGARDFAQPLTPIAGHDSKQFVTLQNGKNVQLGALNDRDLVNEITKLTITWNRSGARNKPLPELEEFDFTNKAKLEEGVSHFFSANKTASGREFSYDSLLADLEKEYKLDQEHIRRHEAAQNPQNSFTAVTAKRHHDEQRLEQLQAMAQPQNDEENNINNNDPDNTITQTETIQYDPTYTTEEPAAAPLSGNNPHNIHIPAHIQNLIKKTSAFNQLEVKKPKVDVTSQLAGTAEDMNTQVIHHDFLHNSVLRRKPVGKLSDVQIRDLLVDASRFHSFEAIVKHYGVSMLSLFEDTRSSQPISFAADVVGGFSPINLRVKADFDEGFLQMIDILHKNQIEMKTKRMQSRGVSAENIEEDQQHMEDKYLGFMKRLTDAKDGYVTLSKDDVLIPDFPDSMLELLLTESLGKTIYNGDTKSATAHDDQHDTMRDTMIKELIILKGKTIGELHQLGIFNQAPYDLNQSAFDNPTPLDGSRQEDTQVRNKYAFNDEMKHMHRAVTQDELDQAEDMLYGGKVGDNLRNEYYTRVENKYGVKNPLKEGEKNNNNNNANNKTNNKTKSLYTNVDEHSTKRTVGGKGQVKLETISRFAQQALAATVIGKYGSMSDNYRSTAGISMDNVNTMIVEALDEGDLDIKKWPAAEQQSFIAKLKQESLEFPQIALKHMIDNVRVPYLVMGRFDKIPSRFLGVWDVDFAYDSERIERTGTFTRDTYPLGPFHPLFLVTVGGKGYQAERDWEPRALRAMLGGEIDIIRRRQRDEREAKLMATPDGKVTEKFFEIKNLDEIAEIGSESEEAEDISSQTTTKATTTTDKSIPTAQDNNTNTKSSSQSSSTTTKTTTTTQKQTTVDDEALNNLKKDFFKQKETEFESITERLDSVNPSKHSTTTAQTKPLFDDDNDHVGAQKVKLNDDPNEIRFNTSSMTEFHHVNITNEEDITYRPKHLIEGGFKSVEQFKHMEEKVDEDFDQSAQWSLKHFVKGEYQQKKKEELDQKHGTVGEIQAVQEVPAGLTPEQLNDPEYYAANRQKVFENFDMSKYSPDEFHSKRLEKLKQTAQSNLKENAIRGEANQYHELYGGPVTVDQYIGKIVETERGHELSQKIQQEHKSWLNELSGTKNPKH